MLVKKFSKSLALAAATLAALAASAAFGPSFAAPYKTYTLQCQPRYVTACPAWKHLVCVKRDGNGCCQQSKCYVN